MAAPDIASHGPVAALTPEAISTDTLRSVLQTRLEGKDLDCISAGEVRAQVAMKLGFASDGLERRKKLRKLMETKLRSFAATGRFRRPSRLLIKP